MQFDVQHMCQNPEVQQSEPDGKWKLEEKERFQAKAWRQLPPISKEKSESERIPDEE